MRPGPELLVGLCGSLASACRRQAMDAAHAAVLTDPGRDSLDLAKLAGRHLVLTMLAPAFRLLDLERRMADDFRRYLTVMHERNLARNLALREQMLGATGVLNRAGIEPLLLKGAGRLVDRLYPDEGWRFMRDLDILVPRDQLEEACQALLAVGYRPTMDVDPWPEDYHHLPPLYREGEAAVIELHGEALRHGIIFCPTDRLLERAHRLEVEGVAARLADAPDQIACVIGHDRFDDDQRRSGLFRLKSLLELALLCRDAAHVRTFRARIGESRLVPFAEVRLALAAALFPTLLAAPAGIGLPVRLRRNLLLGVERLDSKGRFRRFVGFARTRAAKLLRSDVERRHLSAHALSLAYHQRCLRRLQQLWASD